MENQILKILTNHQGHYISGQDISEKLHVSRMTISTYIKGLKEKGYQIETSTKKGYCLTQNNDIIFIDDIKKQLHPFYQNIDYFDEIESTNQHMKSHAQKQRSWYPWSYITSQYRQQTADPLRRILTRGWGNVLAGPPARGWMSSASSWYILTAGSRTRAMTSAESRMIF